MKRRPSISLVVMSLLGLVWCSSWTSLQGDTPGESPDQGWVAGWISYFILTGGVLLTLWWKRVRAWVVIVAPVVGTVVTFTLILKGWVPDTSADNSDNSTFVDGFWPVLLWAIIAAGITGVIGWLALRHQAAEHASQNGGESPTAIS